MREIYYTVLYAYSGSSTRRILIESLGLLSQLWPYIVIGVNIRFSFPASVKASVDIYDINGKFVSHIGEGYYGAGLGKLSWNLTGNTGK